MIPAVFSSACRSQCALFLPAGRGQGQKKPSADLPAAEVSFMRPNAEQAIDPTEQISAASVR